MSENQNNYDASHIQVLEGLEAVRKRPAMYIGDTSIKGLHHLVSEVVDNCIDEALAGYCNDIKVTILPDNSIKVVDNGRGIPVDMHQKEHRSALEVVMTVLHAGGKFDKNTYKVSGGLHGVGVSCVNALSDQFTAIVHRQGHIYRQDYAFGKPLTGVDVIGDADDTGTTIIFHPDASIFTETVYEWDRLAERLRDLSYLNTGIRLSLTDERPESVQPNGQPRHQEFYSNEGLKEFVKWLDESRVPLIPHIVHLVTESDGVPVEVALTYNTGYSETIYSFVNNINTHEGGTHLDGFRSALGSALKDYGNKEKMFEKAKVEIKAEDFKEGLTAVVSVKVAEPQFEGQTKTKLGNVEVRPAVTKAVRNAMDNYLEEHPSEAHTIIEKVILAAQARVAARKARENVQKNSRLTGGGLPGKLADCSSKNPEECEIFLVEGDSAGGTAKTGRNRFFQAILPLRGKILNVEKVLIHKMLDSEEIQNMFRAFRVNLREDKSLDISTLRYHKIIIMTDADVDGAHIATLIMTLFFRYMRPLIEGGYVYIAQAPLYKCSIGKVEEYCWDDAEQRSFFQQYGQGKEDKIKVQRYKGLGEMNSEQLWDTTMDPAHRRLKKVSIEDAISADQTFSLLMGEDVAPRREFIESNATYANIDA
ncbi:MAG: DNA topoisomerase (ATP-hydrolyzing) subunit B [Bacteroidales bacterium]|jgi:DNA gyrase subunit B|nr:DNA topoisomerase (ATP-hydrolyzing) subunit B [Bacteroidales bacterium]MBP5213037.1 DNA topoisomerase (ATP-hydrolyzing) subunit B [Bacteroidales bacterium]